VLGSLGQKRCRVGYRERGTDPIMLLSARHTEGRETELVKRLEALPACTSVPLWEHVEVFHGVMDGTGGRVGWSPAASQEGRPEVKGVLPGISAVRKGDPRLLPSLVLTVGDGAREPGGRGVSS
jgi:hypothetical protein